VAAERDLLKRLEGGCQLPFGINIQPVGREWRLEVFLAGTGDGPLRVTLEGSDLDALAAEGWEMISEYRETERR
jgi:porphobilinogen deaminase